MSGYVKENEAEFIRLVRETAEIRLVETAKNNKKKLERSQKRCTELDTLIQKIYEDKVSGSLSKKRFEIPSRQYENEQEELENQNRRTTIWA